MNAIRTETVRSLTRSTGIEVKPDPQRVVARLFIPGLEEVGPTGSRAGAVIDRILKFDEDSLDDLLTGIYERFGSRHRNLMDIFDGNAERVMTLVGPDVDMSPLRRRLLGACFTHEYSIEGAALCNPSMVAHPEPGQGGEARFIMSVRGIGEGHRSSIGFRTGSVSASGEVMMDDPSPHAHSVTGTPGVHHRSVFHARLDLLGDDFTNIAHFLATLPPTFDDADLGVALDTLAADAALRRLTPLTIGHITELARWSYQVQFADDSDISERVLWPHAPPEYHGMEYARFVRFTNDDGSVTYYGTYTAFDRSNISQQLLQTDDFCSFTSSPIAGAAALGKGLALFPRKVQGRYMALTRADRETNGLASSDDIHHWATTETIQTPEQPWEVLQLGNCGSPIETDAGWLVLTHGVGPMRTYAIGALLLDLENPSRVVAKLTEPLLFPDDDHREGYVPNVVYSCGAFAHEDTLVLPYGVADQWIAISTTSIDGLIAAMTPLA